MGSLTYILKHLRHNWIRTGSTVAAMAVCIFLFVVLQTFLAAVNFSLQSASDVRLVTRHAVSLVFQLPLSYRERIKTVPGVESVAYANWFGGVYQDPKNFFANFAIDAEPYLAMYPEYIMPPEDYRAFLKDRRGAVVGRGRRSDRWHRLHAQRCLRLGIASFAGQLRCLQRHRYECAGDRAHNEHELLGRGLRVFR